MKLRFKLSIKIMIILSMVLISVLGLTSVFIYNYSSEQISQNIVAIADLQADSVRKDVSKVFENAEISTEYLGLNSSVRSYLKEVETRDDITSNAHFKNVQDFLVSMVNYNDKHFLTWIANEKANFYIDSFFYVSGEDYDVPKRPWYEVANETMGVGLTAPYIEWETKEVVVSSVKALRDGKGVYGYVAVDIVLADIPDIVNMMRQGQGDKSFLITGDGTYVYSPDSSKIAVKSMFDPDDAMSVYEEVIRKAEGDLVEIDLNNQAYYLISHRLDDRGWLIVTLIDTNRVMDKAQNQSYTTIGMVFAGMLITMILIYITINVTTKPYKILVSFGDRIASGDFSQNVPDKYLGRQDEMGDLSKSFQSITDTFRSVNMRLELEIDKKNRELESQFQKILEQEKQASLGYMVAGVAHHINTPVGNSLSMASYMGKEADLLAEKINSQQLSKRDLDKFIDKHRQSVEILTKSLSGASDTIDNFKMIATDFTQTNLQVFKVINVINAVIIALDNDHQEDYHISVIDEDVTIKSYPSILSQVFSHLIINSFKHGFSNRQYGEIAIKIHEEDDGVIINYSDDGAGMSQESVDHLYEMFYTTAPLAGSSGLGMYIVFNNVTNKLGGSIEFTSKVYEGVHFTITLPKKVAD